MLTCSPALDRCLAACETQSMHTVSDTLPKNTNKSPLYLSLRTEHSCVGECMDKYTCVDMYIQMKLLNVEVAYKKGGGYTFTENTEQDGRLMYLLAKKLNMFLGVYSVLNDTDLYTNIQTSNTNTTQEKLYKFRALEGES